MAKVSPRYFQLRYNKVVEVLLTDEEFSFILKDPSKKIDGDIYWKVNKRHLPAWSFRVPVATDHGWPLFIHGSFNPKTKSLSFVLVLQSEGRIYGLDMGKSHRNPQGKQVGRVHKHSWTESYRDKVAYVPADITSPASNPKAVWQEFCKEARIQHNGTLRIR